MRDQYAAQAVTLRRCAPTAGYFKDRRNIEYMKKDPDLDSLRGREDYKKLMAELEEGVKKEMK